MNIDRESRQAFFRRIHKVVRYDAYGRIYEYLGVDAYLKNRDSDEEFVNVEF